MSDAIPRGPFDQGLFLTHFNKGREAFEAKRYDEAERQLEEAYLLRPRDTRVLNLLGLVYFRAEKLVKAEEVYRKLIAQNPDADTLYYNLGLICFKLARLEDAEQAFRKAVELSGGNPKLHFYLGSIYERLHRYKDAIYNYRQAGANLMVQRLQVKIESGHAASPDSTLPPLAPPERRSSGASGSSAAAPTAAGWTASPHAVATEAVATEADAASTAPDLGGSPPDDETEPFGNDRVLRAISPTLLAGASAVAPTPDALGSGSDAAVGAPPAATAGDAGGGGDAVAAAVLEELAGGSANTSTPRPSAARGQVFRSLERSLLEVDFAGKVVIKQGTIYSYSGNLTFWVKDERPGGHPPLVIVTGTGRLLLTDRDREITLLDVAAGEPVFVDPGHLLACEAGLEPRFESVAGHTLVALEGEGAVALSVATKPLRLSVRPDQPVSILGSALVAWTGALAAEPVDDPQVFAVVLSAGAAQGRLLRLSGSGRVLVEQAPA